MSLLKWTFYLIVYTSSSSTFKNNLAGQNSSENFFLKAFNRHLLKCEGMVTKFYFNLTSTVVVLTRVFVPIYAGYFNNIVIVHMCWIIRPWKIYISNTNTILVSSVHLNSKNIFKTVNLRKHLKLSTFPLVHLKMTLLLCCPNLT